MNDITSDTEGSVCPPVMQQGIGRLYVTIVSYVKVNLKGASGAKGIIFFRY